MTKVAIKIPDDLQPFLDESVKIGAFSDAEDFLVNLLYNVKAQSESDLSEEQQAKLTTLRAEIAAGIEQADRGTSSSSPPPKSSRTDVPGALPKRPANRPVRKFPKLKSFSLL
jgi:Arc/MetJ-type ribon-helix-helix transcriptional regulator